MLIGYVSDERYVAVADVLVEFQQAGATVVVVRSTPRGAVQAELAPGDYRVTLVKDGFGSKSVTMTVDPARPYQFRLLTDGLLGYVWPRAVKAGERSEFRVHATESYRLSLWRYGWKREFVKLLGWFDEHGPRAVMQITPDGDYTQSGVQWNKTGYGSPHHTQLVAGPARSGLYYFHAKGEKSGEFFSFPWVVAPAQPSAPMVSGTCAALWCVTTSMHFTMPLICVSAKREALMAASYLRTPTFSATDELCAVGTTAAASASSIHTSQWRGAAPRSSACCARPPAWSPRTTPQTHRK